MPIWDTSYYSGPGYAGGGGNAFPLAQQTNSFMTGQAQAPYIANLPGYLSNIGKSSANTGDQLAGRFTSGQMRNFQQQAAERGIATGSPGAGFIDAGYLAEILKQTGALQQQGEANLSGGVGRTPVPQLFNPASLFVPQMLAQQELAAAQAGRRSGGGGGGGGGQTSGLSPTRSTSWNPTAAWEPPQAVGSNWATGYNMQGGGNMTDAEIEAIANGDLDQGWQNPSVNPQGQDRGSQGGFYMGDQPQFQQSKFDEQYFNRAPQGTWYDPQTDTSNMGFGDFENYFQ